MTKIKKKSKAKSAVKNYPLGTSEKVSLLGEPRSQYSVQLPFSDFFEQNNGIEQFDIEEKLRQLMKYDLTFKGEKTSYATHNLHAFAAKFPPQLPRLFIQELTKPGENVLDPMVGSGTAVVEAVLTGRNGVGVDLDPLAVLIALVKSSPFDLPKCAQIGHEILKRARERGQTIIYEEINNKYSPQAVEFFKYWFEDHTINELYSLIQEINALDAVDCKNFFKVVFSSMIITKSGSLTRARDLAHSRPHRDLNRQVKHIAYEVFAERLRVFITSMENIVESSGNSLTIRADARVLPIKDNSIHLIVTSPPYAANAIDYMRAHKFSLIWIGHSPRTLTDLRRIYIGSERKSKKLEFASESANQVLMSIHKKNGNRAAVVAHYFHDMENSLREMLRVLAEGRAAILVVGSSVIRGVDIKAPTVLAELANSLGFKLVDVVKREIVRDARMMPVSNNSDRNGIEARMHEEGVIALIKPKKENSNANA